mmetsp:Transcript_34411/g.52693  ORF Transcript_34411/g.52693 Transcript_34411/m.52693 type:complete len:98 (+) Transcript_34411:442-735(+)
MSSFLFEEESNCLPYEKKLYNVCLKMVSDLLQQGLGYTMITDPTKSKPLFRVVSKYLDTTSDWTLFRVKEETRAVQIFNLLNTEMDQDSINVTEEEA